MVWTYVQKQNKTKLKLFTNRSTSSKLNSSEDLSFFKLYLL